MDQLVNFYRATLCVSVVFAVGWCPSFSLSVTFVYRIQTEMTYDVLMGTLKPTHSLQMAENIVKVFLGSVTPSLYFFKLQVPVPNSKRNPFRERTQYMGSGTIFVVVTHGDGGVLGDQPRHYICRDASRGLSATNEFLLSATVTDKRSTDCDQ